jgi:hypothetical protein
MTSIDNAGRFAGLFGARPRSAEPERISPSRVAGSGLSRTGGTVDSASLAASRIQALSPDDPQRRSKGLRIVLEAVLLQELGAAVANDLRFSDLVSAVQRDMQADSQIAAAANALVDALAAAKLTRR